MSVIQHIVMQINSGLIAMADDRIEMEGIREAANDSLLIPALVFFGCSRRSAGTRIPICDILHFIYVRDRSIDSIGILRLSFCRSCRNSHVYSVNYLVGGFVQHRDEPLAAGLHRSVKLNYEVCVNIDAVSVLLGIKADRRLCHEVHTYDTHRQSDKDSFHIH